MVEFNESTICDVFYFDEIYDMFFIIQGMSRSTLIESYWLRQK